MDRDAILDWLLEEDNPPVRLLTLARLLRRPEVDTDEQQPTLALLYGVAQAAALFWRGAARTALAGSPGSYRLDRSATSRP